MKPRTSILAAAVAAALVAGSAAGAYAFGPDVASDATHGAASAGIAADPAADTAGGAAARAPQPRPAGKVQQGYWENWDGASNGVHPGMGWVPITDPAITEHGYNVATLAFPVIRPDGTVLWEDGM